ncbi:MAG: hypothetical protein K9M82_13380, partial [Deltaproteobacteria bacterium]|nr:hypothetical protein [Deltaproteobacteria bacterium]
LEGADRRPAMLWETLRFFNRAEAPVQARLFDSRASERLRDRERPPRPLSLEDRLRDEVETLGFPLSVHPLGRYGELLRGVPRCLARDLPSRVGRRVTLAGWPVTGKTVHSQKGDPMKFVSFEDETGLYETVFFPREYRRFCHMLGKGRAYVLRGKVAEELGAITVTAGWIGFLDRQGPAGTSPKAAARARPYGAGPAGIEETFESLAAEPGRAWVDPKGAATGCRRRDP